MFSTIVYGGSFDPPHKGHRTIVEKVLDRFPESHVLIVPASDPPHKRDLVRTSFKDRFSMCLLAFENLPRTEVSDIEEGLPKPSYTLQTISELNKNSKGEIALLIGGDSLDSFSSWYKYTELLEITNLLVYPREKHKLIIPKELIPFSDRIYFVEDKILSESSTKVREGNLDMIDTSVLNYIQEKELYQM